jgi:DNA-binding NtrC family response regulator
MLVASGGQAQLTPAHLPDRIGWWAEETDAARRAVHAPRKRLPTSAEAQAALVRNNFTHGRAAAELGISRHQLYRLLKRAASAVVAVDRARASSAGAPAIGAARSPDESR